MIPWREGVNVDVRSFYKFHINPFMNLILGGEGVLVMDIYEVLWRPGLMARHFCCDSLRRLYDTFLEPWICTIDFNELLFDHKHVSRCYKSASIRGFLEALVNCNLRDLGYFGSKLTWNNNRVRGVNVQTYLDQFYTNQSRYYLFSSAHDDHHDLEIPSLLFTFISSFVLSCVEQ